MLRTLARLAATTTVIAVVVAALVVLSGWARVVVTEGVSMEPLYHQGDMIVTIREPHYAIGDIVAYHGGTKGLVVLHRIIGGTPAAFVIKGDNNTSDDPHHPAEDQILGRAVLHVAGGGLVLRPLTSPAALVVVVVVVAVTGMGGSVLSTRGRRRARARRARDPDVRRQAPRREPRRRGPPPQVPPATRPSAVRMTPLPPPLQTALAVAGAFAVAGLVLGAVSWTRPTTVDALSTAASPRSMTFSYSASVPFSAVYDSTTVHSPQPIFRALAQQVEVHYSYRGVPGRLSTALRLSTLSGWSTTEQVTPPVAVLGTGDAGVATLDLPDLSARAERAAAVIGVAPGDLRIEYVVRVAPDTGPVFKPTLSMTLSPTRLALVGKLSQHVAPAVERSRVVSREIHLLMITLPVGGARWLSVLLLVAAGATAAAVMVLARGGEEPDESQRILRQHAALIVPVSPVPSPNGRPVAEVTDFAALAKIAERYGLAVLHWERSGVSTFVVHDEGVTYRYRTPVDGRASTGTSAIDEGPGPEACEPPVVLEPSEDLEPPGTVEDLTDPAHRWKRWNPASPPPPRERREAIRGGGDFTDFWGSAPLARHRRR